MFTVTNVSYITIPALSTVLAFVALLRRRATVLAICNDCWGQGQKDAGPWSIIWELKRITKFLGTSLTLTCFNIWASRVGSQCLVPGVALQTLKIFCKCSSDCRSPLSCHLNSLCGFINCITASTQPGCLRASSLRSIADLTLLNLYRPFRA